MRIRLEIEDDPQNGFVVRYREEGSSYFFNLFDSLSRRLAVNTYHTIRRRIDLNNFPILDTKETAIQTYTLYGVAVHYVPVQNIFVERKSDE